MRAGLEQRGSPRTKLSGVVRTQSKSHEAGGTLSEDCGPQVPATVNSAPLKLAFDSARLRSKGAHGASVKDDRVVQQHVELIEEIVDVFR